MTSTRRSSLGDLVAVFQTGGILAQFDTPDAILGAPASDFVARFVGTDRGLKRLSLSRVSDLEPRPALTGRVGEDAAAARARVLSDSAAPWLLLLDGGSRPLGWVHERRIPHSGVLTVDIADPAEAVLTPRMTLRDALSLMLDADVISGVVVDEQGRAQGVLTVDQLAGALR